MPEMNSTRLLAALKEAAPKMRQVVITNSADSGKQLRNGPLSDSSSNPPDVNQLLKAIKGRIAKKDETITSEEDVCSNFAESEVIGAESERDL